MSNTRVMKLMATGAAAAMGWMLAATPAAALTVRDDVTVEGSEDRADDPQYDGVVQIYLLTPTGGIFFNCTGSLINPRTVLSAAHCFNDSPSSDYGLAPGQLTPIVAYGPDTFDGLFNWINTGNLELDERNGITFGNQVIIHPDADPAFGFPLFFPGADVAMISLDDPLSQLPTYSMLFSQLPVGTHVQMVGYGTHGLGSVGTQSIDGKRQAGENILGLVGSQNDFLRGAFGTDFDFGFGVEDNQLLYYTDFDNPVRDESVCSRDNTFFGFPGLVCDDPTKPINGIFGPNDDVVVVTDDIDWFPGEALPFESGTAGGDSGSALFADELVEDSLIITGVLSGGFNFTAPAPSGYGDVSYYNPLFLFHDFISEANPYKYVSAAAGDGNWSDPDHWVQQLDPNYLIIDAEGNVINGLPDGNELGVLGQDPREGIVFDTDISTFTTPASGQPVTTADNQGFGAVSYKADSLVTSIGGSDLSASSEVPGIADLGLDYLPSADPIEDPELVTFLYGDIGSPGPFNGPGATGAVPNNGVNANGFFNYFDITLNAAGTTTADIDVVIDRLTIDNADAGLTIADGVQFVSLVDTQIASGTLNVNGIFGSRDILNGGRLTGGANGEIVTDTLYNMGVLAAGGGLQVFGDVVLTSASTLEYRGTSLSVDGSVSLGGIVDFESLAPGQSGQLINFTGTQIGAFSTANFNNNQGVRQLNFTYGANSVDYSITAERFSTFLSDAGMDANTAQMVALLDGVRDSDFAALQELYDAVDFLPADALAGRIAGLTPENAFQPTGLAQLSSSALPQHLSNRIGAVRAGNGFGTQVAQRSAPMQLASMNNRDMFNLLDQAEETGGGTASADPGTVKTGARYGAFVEVSFSTGSQSAGIGADDSDIDGTAVTLGLDGELSEGLVAGVFAHYAEGDSDFNSGLAVSESDGYTLGVYGDYASPLGDLAGYVGIGQRDIETLRSGILGSLAGGTDADELIAGLGLTRTYEVDSSTGFSATPELRVDYQAYDIDGYTEIGNASALTIDDREYTSIQVKLGGDLHFYDVASPQAGGFKPSLGARVVYDLDGERDVVTARFANGSGGSTILSGASRDKTWGELRGALNFAAENAPITAAVFAEGTVGREDLSYLTVGFNVEARF